MKLRRWQALCKHACACSLHYDVKAKTRTLLPRVSILAISMLTGLFDCDFWTLHIP